MLIGSEWWIVENLLLDIVSYWKMQQSVGIANDNKQWHYHWNTKVEYMAATQATKEAIWLRHLLQDLGLQQNNPTKIYCENQSCIALTQNPKFHARTKHVEYNITSYAKKWRIKRWSWNFAKLKSSMQISWWRVYLKQSTLFAENNLEFLMEAILQKAIMLATVGV